MSRVHLYVGYAIPAGFALLALWSLVTFFRNKPPASGYWTLLGVLQVVLGVQIAVGVILFLMGLTPPTEIPWLHYAYGGLFPAFLLVVAHRQARKHVGAEWVFFGFAALLSAGLTFRALSTGLG